MVPSNLGVYIAFGFLYDVYPRPSIKERFLDKLSELCKVGALEADPIY